ncbi:heparan-alpha-glucosaminide N-acetyltransferase-like [Prunus avium]|uniref:Heparan-alpha-glucosaminide N-acetyltransferase-like n=1 Tax=Prunus avium TaxID=42229 RepID=A0A6P5SJK7_PRUAV|nr:heparan-alpha-glucosaminide N-acetyltransferase-like [Prunus avium]
MILVDDAGGSYARIDHSPWNGCTLADFVMPFFLFIVGVAIALALKKIPKINDAIQKIILRTLKLMFWGIILQGGYSHAPDDLSYGVEMKQIRWFGILQDWRVRRVPRLHDYNLFIVCSGLEFCGTQQRSRIERILG